MESNGMFDKYLKGDKQFPPGTRELEPDESAADREPEERPEEALAQLEELQTEHALLDRPLAQIDMRVPNRVAIRVHPVLAGGLRPLLGGA